MNDSLNNLARASRAARTSQVRAERALPQLASRKQQFRRDKRDVHGWVVLDKPVGMTSTHAVERRQAAVQGQTRRPRRHARSARVRLPAGRAGRSHQDRALRDGRRASCIASPSSGAKSANGRQRGTGHRDQRPTGPARGSGALLPPLSARSRRCRRAIRPIKIEGERAYDLARDGETVELEPREVDIDRLEVVEVPSRSRRAGGRMRQGHLRPLARPRHRPRARLFRPCERASPDGGGLVYPETMISLEDLEAMCHRAAAGEASLADALMPVETALDDIPALAVSRADAARLARGQAVLLRGRDAPIFSGTVYVTSAGRLLALAEVDRGEIVPKRVFNLAGLVGRARPQKCVKRVRRTSMSITTSRKAEVIKESPRSPAIPVRRKSRWRSSPSASTI